MSYLHLYLASKSDKILTFEEPPRTFSDLYDRKNFEDKIYDTKTIWGSDIVKFAVNQANDALDLEEILAETNFLLICPKENKSDPFENVVVNEIGNIIFYCVRTYNWSSGFCRSLCECHTGKFGYRLLNSSFREVLKVSGQQCCYSSGLMKVTCGIYDLGSIYQYCTNGNGRYDIFNSEIVKVGEIRQILPYSPLGEETILYGLSFIKDIPIHEKHLLLGSSFLLYYQKYGAWNNKRTCQWSILCKVMGLLVLLGICSLFVVLYQI
ncbi:unnamed protein product [Allacma fusca]|uniref:Uncharacterized protein n=1 Tax=Allacma fusca TaxID=39272 RepID=A0A8J2PFY9_9HEXA|nr:unnamed protein product [Allacma fusca]